MKSKILLSLLTLIFMGCSSVNKEEIISSLQKHPEIIGRWSSHRHHVEINCFGRLDANLKHGSTSGGFVKNLTDKTFETDFNPFDNVFVYKIKKADGEQYLDVKFVPRGKTLKALKSLGDSVSFKEDDFQLKKTSSYNCSH